MLQKEAGPGFDYQTGSSIRWKKNNYTIPEPLHKIQVIRGFNFDWDDTTPGMARSQRNIIDFGFYMV